MPASSIRTAIFLPVLLLGSGFASLVYQVLWMKQLGLLFGSTSQSAAVTLAVFFAGLAAGSAYFGRRAGGSIRPLRLYAWLEVFIALTALTYYVLIHVFESRLPGLMRPELGPWPLLLTKFGLAALLIFPPAFGMGGTLPVMAEYGVRHPTAFGRTASRLYAFNTLGAAVGVAAAAFVLVPMLGFRLTYAVAVAISILVAMLAWFGSSREEPEHPPLQDPVVAAAAPEAWLTLLLSFLSGFTVLALEVVWTRMFAQVHENSVYAFSIILIVVLVGLAAGAWISSRLARLPLPVSPVLGVLLMAGGLALALNPPLFLSATDGMTPVTQIESWGRFVYRVMVMGFVGIGPVVLVLGVLFPYLMKCAEIRTQSPGRLLGRLMMCNTAGAILGAMLCGFVFLPAFGMWGTLRWMAVIYFLAALCFPYGIKPLAFGCRILAAMFILFLFTLFDPARLSPTAVDPNRPKEKVLKIWETPDCTVSVVVSGNENRAIKVNSCYVLGSTYAFVQQANQARIPLMFRPQTENIFFLGMGTGMSAAAALRPEFPAVRQVTTCELIPEVVEASKSYMPGEMVGALYEDPRSVIRIGDGRHHLLASQARYDMINADLFVPYQRGAGSLYSLEHYQVASRRLHPGGCYVQWLPLYQLSRDDFGVIVRTMLEVFPEVTMWRNHFTPGNEVVALVGCKEPMKVPPVTIQNPEKLGGAVDDMTLDQVDPSMIRAAPETIALYYGGNLGAARHWFAGYPLNTDDRPVIEYQAPRDFRKESDPMKVWFVGPQIADLTEKLFENCPPESDPVLEQRAPENRRFARTGLAFHRAMIAKALGRKEEGNSHWSAFLREWRRAAGLSE